MDTEWQIINDITENYEIINHSIPKYRPIKKPPRKPPIKPVTVQPMELKR